MLGLFTRDLQSSFFSFRRECLDLEGLSVRERKFDFREMLDVKEPLVGERIRDLGRRIDESVD